MSHYMSENQIVQQLGCTVTPWDSRYTAWRRDTVRRQPYLLLNILTNTASPDADGEDAYAMRLHLK